MKRNHNIDCIRCLACLGVIILHTIFPYAVKGENLISSYPMLFFYNIGMPAVPLFFMASGYFVLNKKYSFDKILNKIIKIIYFVTFWNIIVFLARGYVHHSFSLRDFLIIVLGPYIQKGYFVQLWFLGSLIFMYLLLIPLQKIKRQWPKIYYMIGVVAICISIAINFASTIDGVALQSKICQTFRLITWLSYFMLGDFIHLVPRINMSNVNRITIVIFFIVVSIINSSGIEFIIHNYHAEYVYNNVISYITIIIIFVMIRGYSLSAKGITVIDKFTPLLVNIYLVHLVIIQIYSRLFLPKEAIIELLFVMFLSIVLSVFMNKILFIKKINSI